MLELVAHPINPFSGRRPDVPPALVVPERLRRLLVRHQSFDPAHEDGVVGDAVMLPPASAGLPDSVSAGRSPGNGSRARWRAVTAEELWPEIDVWIQLDPCLPASNLFALNAILNLSF
jgi:hypothetical protein